MGTITTVVPRRMRASWIAAPWPPCSLLPLSKRYSLALMARAWALRTAVCGGSGSGVRRPKRPRRGFGAAVFATRTPERVRRRDDVPASASASTVGEAVAARAERGGWRRRFRLRARAAAAEKIALRGRRGGPGRAEADWVEADVEADAEADADAEAEAVRREGDVAGRREGRVRRKGRGAAKARDGLRSVAAKATDIGGGGVVSRCVGRGGYQRWVGKTVSVMRRESPGHECPREEVASAALGEDEGGGDGVATKRLRAGHGGRRGLICANLCRSLTADGSGYGKMSF